MQTVHYSDNSNLSYFSDTLSSAFCHNCKVFLFLVTIIDLYYFTFKIQIGYLYNLPSLKMSITAKLMKIYLKIFRTPYEYFKLSVI